MFGTDWWWIGVVHLQNHLKLTIEYLDFYQEKNVFVKIVRVLDSFASVRWSVS